MLLVPEPMLGAGVVLVPMALPEPMAPLLEPMAPDAAPELMLEVSVEGVEGADIGDGVLDVDGVVVVSSVFLLHAPSASNADRAMAVARAGLIRDANISVSF